MAASKKSLGNFILRFIFALIYILPIIAIVTFKAMTGADIQILVSKDVINSIMTISGILIPFSAILYSSTLRIVKSSMRSLLRMAKSRSSRVSAKIYEDFQTIIDKVKKTIELFMRNMIVEIEGSMWSNWMGSIILLLTSVFTAFTALLVLEFNQLLATILVTLAFSFLWSALVTSLESVYDCYNVYKRFKQELDKRIKDIAERTVKELEELADQLKVKESESG